MAQASAQDRILNPLSKNEGPARRPPPANPRPPCWSQTRAPENFHLNTGAASLVLPRAGPPSAQSAPVNNRSCVALWYLCRKEVCEYPISSQQTNRTCHSGLSRVSYPPHHMLVCSNTLFTFLLANYLLLSVVRLGAGRSVMGESQPFSN